jgi:hypothetical protein
MKQKIIKVITLIMFIGSITAFVIYRSVGVGESLPLSPNGSVINSVKSDSTPALKFKSKAMMSSSKVIILSDPQYPTRDTVNIFFKFDSVKRRRLELMGSSKSMILFKPEILTDSTKVKKKD